METTPYFVPHEIGMKVVATLFNNIPSVTWLSAFTFVMAFWVEVLTKKFQSDLAKRSKIILISMSIITMILSVVGLLLTSVSIAEIVGVLLILVPFMAATISLIVFVVIIRKFKTEKFSRRLKIKHQWSVSLFTAGAITWVIFLIALFIMTFFVFSSGIPRWPVIFSHIFIRLSESAAAIILMLLVDVKAIHLRTLFALMKFSPHPADPLSKNSTSIHHTTTKGGNSINTSSATTSPNSHSSGASQAS